jgi:hypothetical protein
VDRKLNRSQRHLLADFLSKLAVAWFSGGIITPILIKPTAVFDRIFIPSLGIVMTLIFLFTSLAIIKKVQT